MSNSVLEKYTPRFTGKRSAWEDWKSIYRPQLTIHPNVLSGRTDIQANLTEMGAEWRRSTGVQWGFLVGTFTIEGSEEKLSDYMYQWLGHHIEERVGRVTWEGIIVDLTLNGQVVRRRSLENVYNKVRASYITNDGPQLTDWAEDAGSQARFGIKEFIISGNNQEQTDAERLRDKFLAESAQPVVQRVRAGSQDKPTLDGIAIGYALTTDWQLTQHTFSQDMDGNDIPEASGTLMSTLLAEAQYISSVSVVTNANTVLADVDKRKLKTSIEDVVEKGGDSSTYYRMYMIAGRKAIYEPINFEPKYILYKGEIRTRRNIPIIDPHLIVPAIVRDLSYPRGADYLDSPYFDRRDFLLDPAVVNNGEFKLEIGDLE